MNTPIENLNLSNGDEMAFLSQPSSSDAVIDILNSPEVYSQRLQTCMSCQYVTSDRECTKCGCPVVMMAQFNFKQCPEGVWK